MSDDLEIEGGELVTVGIDEAQAERKREIAYRMGQRAAWLRILVTTLRDLCYLEAFSPDDDPGAASSSAASAVVKLAALAAEREATVAALRRVCADFGDEDWDDDLHLADVVNYHLVSHLERKV